MRPRFTIPLVLMLAVASTAAAQDVRYNFDKAANFASFKTYKWVPIKGATVLADLPDRQVKAAVDAELSRKGLVRSTSDTADLYIGYQAAIGQEKEFTSYDTGWGYGPGYRGRMVRRRRRGHDDGHDNDHLRWSARPRHVRLIATHPRLARRRKQDAG